ncbi:uncharacterized protein CXorf65 homolog isoform X2 [Rattus norvegicus]|uniref:similar to human chromosome X open reading frame 65 isoform 3 n=1 Tax=Rattus norvegicus TaxID=10116 RepID=UPI002FD7BB2C
MFIIIKHGDNQEFLVNTNCSVLLLLHYTRKKMGLRKTGTRIENSYKAIVPLLKHPEPELVESLRTQCEFLERSRIKMLRTLEAKRLAAMESSVNLPARSPKSGGTQQTPSPSSQLKSKGGRSDEDGPPPTRRPFYKTRADFLKRHR